MKINEMIKRVHKKRPGWRFSLLGGDTQMGYRTNKDSTLKHDSHGHLVVDEKSRIPFGWQAEFFGDEDPRLNTGRRHASGYGKTPEEAVKNCCAKAHRMIKQYNEIMSHGKKRQKI